MSRPRVLAALVALSVVGLAGCKSAALSPATGPGTTPPPTAPRASLEFVHFLAYGDSLTEGLATPGPNGEPGGDPARSYPAKLQLLLAARYPNQTIHVVNAGRGGEHVTEGRARFQKTLAAHQPNVVLLMAGANDLLSEIPTPRIIAAIAELIADAQAQGAKVLLSTLPRQRRGGIRAHAIDRLPEFNAALAKLSESTNSTLVDVASAFDLDLLMADGLHLLEAANQALAEEFFAKIRELFERRDR
jgi:lysophospholipase L1-like esterase